MKKILLSVCSLILATATFGQSKMINSPQGMLKKTLINNTMATTPVVTPSNSASAPVTIWTDDFSDPAEWIVAHDPTACSLDWQIGTPTCQGSYQINTIASTSAANGYAMIDSDFYGGATGGTEMEDCWLTMANPVDLNGYPNVIVQFEAQYRSYNNEKAYIVVGIGDGSGNVTWPDLNATTDISTMNNVFEAFPGYTSGDETTNPELIIVDISTALSGLSAVQLADLYIRFHWTGTWGYAWFVDDVAISETPDNAIVSSSEVIGGFWVDYLNYPAAGLNNIVGLDYSYTPLSQLSNHPFSFEASVKNTGLSVQHTVLKYDISGAAVAAGASSSIVLNPQEDSVFAAVPKFGDANTAIGAYSVDIYAEADSAGAGVTITTLPAVTKAFEVTNYIYGKDLGSSNPGWYRVGGPVDQNHLTTRYEMYGDEQLYSLRTFISDRSAVGAEIKAIIYEADTTATSGVLFYDESDNYTITAQDLGAWVDIPFVSAISLFNGYAYECGIVGFQHPTDSSFIGISGGSMYNGEHSVFDEFGLSTQSAGTPTWYYTTSCPMVRMNFDPGSVTIQTFDCAGVGCIDPGTGNGAYSSFAACQAACVVATPSWDCDGNGNCYDPGTGNGAYSSSTACQAACSPNGASWDCVGASCIDPGTGNGAYSSQSACLTACAVTPSWDCIGVSCIDPGDGSGQYSVQSNCVAACGTSGLEETQSSVSIYPNPSKGIFAIKLDVTAKYDVTVYNVLGQTVLSTFTNKMITTIDLSSFEKGIYTIELKDKEAIYIEKVIVE